MLSFQLRGKGILFIRIIKKNGEKSVFLNTKYTKKRKFTQKGLHVAKSFFEALLLQVENGKKQTRRCLIRITPCKPKARLGAGKTPLPHRKSEGVQPLYLRQMTSKKEKKVFFEILIK
jgi:hypothetical protein